MSNGNAIIVTISQKALFKPKLSLQSICPLPVSLTPPVSENTAAFACSEEAEAYKFSAVTETSKRPVVSTVNKSLFDTSNTKVAGAYLLSVVLFTIKCLESISIEPLVSPVSALKVSVCPALLVTIVTPSPNLEPDTDSDSDSESESSSDTDSGGDTDDTDDTDIPAVAKTIDYISVQASAKIGKIEILTTKQTAFSCQVTGMAKPKPVKKPKLSPKSAASISVKPGDVITISSEGKTDIYIIGSAKGRAAQLQVAGFLPKAPAVKVSQPDKIIKTLKVTKGNKDPDSILTYLEWGLRDSGNTAWIKDWQALSPSNEIILDKPGLVALRYNDKSFNVSDGVIGNKSVKKSKKVK